MSHPLDLLNDPAGVRTRCAALVEAVRDERCGHWRIDEGALDRLARHLADLAAGHGLTASARRVPGPPGAGASSTPTPDAEFEALLLARDPREAVRIRLDRAFVSACLSADPGESWRYLDRPVQTLALPVQRQSGEDLLSLLGQASATGPQTASAPAAGPAPNPGPTPAETEVLAPDAPSGAVPATAPDLTAGLGGLQGLDAAVTRAFLAGAFSSEAHDPLRADAQALKRLDLAALRALFQVSAAQPLAGLEGRAALVRGLGEALQAQAASRGGTSRPCRLLEDLEAADSPGEVSASDLLRWVLALGSGAWPGGRRVQGLGVGDVWPSRWAGAQTGAGRDPTTAGWAPLHHLAQRIVRRLAPALQQAGWAVSELSTLTAGSDPGLVNALITTGVLVPRYPADLDRAWPVGHEAVIVARAVTVVLVEALAARQPAGTALPDLEDALRQVADEAARASPATAGLRLRIAPDPITDGTLF